MHRISGMGQRISRLFLYVLFLCLFFTATAENLFAEETETEAGRITSIINKVIGAYGGKDAIESINTLHAKGRTEAFMLHDSGTYDLYFKRARKLRIETKYGQSWELRILHGDRGYRASDSRPLEEVFGPRYAAMVYQYKHLDILHDLVKGTYRIHSSGRSSLNGNDVEVLHLSDKDGAEMDICIDEHNFLIVKVTGLFTEGNKSIALSAEFSDFKNVGGSVFPFMITNYAGEIKIAQTVMEKYLINPEIADSMFEPAVIQSL